LGGITGAARRIGVVNIGGVKRGAGLRPGSGSAPSTCEGGGLADCAITACGAKRPAKARAIGVSRKSVTGMEDTGIRERRW
jgi:hypothetical protein